MGISPTPTLILILTLLSGLVLAGGTDLPVEPVIHREHDPVSGR